MAVLHLIANPLSASKFERSFDRFATPQDPLLFIGDSLSGLLLADQQELLEILLNPMYALRADAICRGIESLLPTYIKLIDDAAMVKLALENEQVVSW